MKMSIGRTANFFAGSTCLFAMMFILAGAALAQVPVFSPGKPVPKKQPVKPVTAVKSAQASSSGSGASGGSGAPASFYGMKVKGKNVVFLLDVSGSMGSRGAENKTRIEIMKEQLLNMLDAFLKDKSRSQRSYKICIFSDGFDSFPRSSMAKMGDKKSYDASRDFASKIHTIGGTNMMRAWEKIFSDSDAGRIDTIYFLSDGYPGDCTPDQLVKFIRSKNQNDRLRINSIAIGNPSPLLRKIAEGNNGTYMECL